MDSWVKKKLWQISITFFVCVSTYFYERPGDHHKNFSDLMVWVTEVTVFC